MICRLSTILISIILLTGCGLKRVKPVADAVIVTKWERYDCGIEPAVDKVRFRPVVWEIENARYTLTTSMYANLGDNMASIISAAGQRVEVIMFYRECIRTANETG